MDVTSKTIECSDCEGAQNDREIMQDLDRFCVLCDCGCEGDWAKDVDTAIEKWNALQKTIRENMVRKYIECVSCGSKGSLDYLSFDDEVEAQFAHPRRGFYAYIRHGQAFGVCERCGCDNGINNNPPNEDHPLAAGSRVRLPSTGELGIVVQTYEDKAGDRRCEVLFYRGRIPDGTAKRETYILDYYQQNLEVLTGDFRLPFNIILDLRNKKREKERWARAANDKTPLSRRR